MEYIYWYSIVHVAHACIFVKLMTMYAGEALQEQITPTSILISSSKGKGCGLRPCGVISGPYTNHWRYFHLRYATT